ncbi:MAG: hypothetical protein JXA54_01305 [Candidatus Heimdallarchaeota archaeon]|nr:hypothetical protein [Candidatus Heimdallarchaeota archaeon]
MSSAGKTRTIPEEEEKFANWKKLPFELKIMDLASIAWFVLIIVNIIFAIFNVELNIRTFAAFFLPIVMFVVTVSMRMRLAEKPDSLRNTFIVWVVLFITLVILTILVLALYPGIIGRT